LATAGGSPSRIFLSCRRGYCECPGPVALMESPDRKPDLPRSPTLWRGQQGRSRRQPRHAYRLAPPLLDHRHVSPMRGGMVARQFDREPRSAARYRCCERFERGRHEFRENLFVRVQTQLRPEPSTPLTPELPILRRGTLLTATGRTEECVGPSSYRESAEGLYPGNGGEIHRGLAGGAATRSVWRARRYHPDGSDDSESRAVLSVPVVSSFRLRHGCQAQADQHAEAHFPRPKAPIKVLTFSP